MNNIILAVVLLGGCFLMHFLMMRKGGHGGSHRHDAEDQNQNEENNKDGKTHSGHSCH